MQITQSRRDELRQKRNSQLQYLKPLHLDKILLEETYKYLKFTHAGETDHIAYSQALVTNLYWHLVGFMDKLRSRPKYHWLSDILVSVEFDRERQNLRIDWKNTAGYRSCK